MASGFELRNLSFAYTDAEVLKTINADFSPGDFVALVGPNGAGKSTLLKIMAGLIRNYRGSVAFGGQNLAAIPARDLAKRIAFVPQETQMAFPFTVSEIVLMGRLPHKSRTLFDTAGDLNCAREAMLLTDTAELASKYFNQLSGGERQRVVLASALAQN